MWGTPFYLLEKSSLSCFKMSFFLGHYNINESLVKQSPKVLMSCFKSKTGRGLQLTSTGPGPGYYDPNDHTKILKKALIPWVLIMLIFLLKGGSGEGPNRSRKGRGVTGWKDNGSRSLSGGPRGHSGCPINIYWKHNTYRATTVCRELDNLVNHHNDPVVGIVTLTS